MTRKDPTLEDYDLYALNSSSSSFLKATYVNNGILHPGGRASSNLPLQVSKEQPSTNKDILPSQPHLHHTMFRDRTNLFLSYRRTIPRDKTKSTESRFDNLIEEEERFIESRRPARYHDTADNANSIELKPLVPSIFNISHELDTNLTIIKQQIHELNSIYKKLIIINKSDKKSLESKIEEYNYQILKNFEKCYILVKKIEYLNVNHEKLKLNYTENDLDILNNYKKTYAIKIQENSIVFRNLQNNYIKFLRDDDDEMDGLMSDTSRSVRNSTEWGRDTSQATLRTSLNTSRTSLDNSRIFDQNLLLEEEGRSSKIEDYSKQVLQQQHNSNSKYLQQREKEISNLAMGILEILTIFKEMESLVVDQGSLLDRIDYNLQNTARDLKESDKELNQARVYQKRTTKCKMIFLLSLIVFALFLIVLVKPHGSTKVVEKPNKPEKPTNPDTRPTLEKPEAGEGGNTERSEVFVN
jgi:t-SNARE complex subunit, syntaxin